MCFYILLMNILKEILKITNIISSKRVKYWKTSTSISLTMLKASDCVDHNELVNSRDPTCLLRNLCVCHEATVRTRHGTTGSKSGKEYIKAVYCHPADLTSTQSTSYKCQAGWIRSQNQDCWEKYQQPPIWRWYYSNGGKWRGTKEPLDEGERGELKSWFET